MRSTILIGVLTLLLLAGCGVSDTTAQRPTASAAAPAVATAGPAQTLPQPSPSVTPTDARPEPTEETMVSTEPPATPEEQPRQEQPTEPPATPRPTFQAAPITRETTVPPTPAGSQLNPGTPIEPALAPQVNGAKADLARRQSVSADVIGVVEARSVVWPDGSLGCPRPGMAYPQVQVEGLLIRLSIGDRIFEYHGGGGKPPFLCEQKS
jgi:hypothetical protein